MARTWLSKTKAQEGTTEKPVLRRFWTSDTTREAVAVILEENPRGIIQLCDELVAWVRGMGEYKGNHVGADRQFELSCWSGEPAIVDRKSDRARDSSRYDRGPLILENPFKSVLGGLTPDMLTALSDERGRDDGFIHRLLFTYPEPLAPGPFTDATISGEAEQKWNDAYSKLAALKSESSGRPRIVRFTEAGKKVWAAWFTSHNAELARPDFPEHLRGAWGKFRSYFPRFALTLQMLRLACGETNSEDVEEESAAGAAALVDYFKSHAERVYKRLRVTPDDKRAVAAERWIGTHGRRCSARDLCRAGIPGILKKSEAEAVLKDLEDRGRGRLTNGRRGGVGIVLGTEGKHRNTDSRRTR